MTNPGMVFRFFPHPMRPSVFHSLFLFLFISGAAIPPWQAVRCGESLASTVPWSARMAQSIMKRSPAAYSYGWDYVTGTVMKGLSEFWKTTGDAAVLQYIKATVDRSVRSDGTLFGYRLSEYNIDQVNEGRMLLFLYGQTGEPRYKKAADTVRSQLMTHPRTSDGGFWHKKIYPWQMWLDGLYMGSPFYAEYAAAFNEPDGLDDVVRQIVLMETHARDAQTGLLFHGWDEKKAQIWADPVTGCSANFWGRGIGWYAMALVEVFETFPSGHPGRDSVSAVMGRLADALVRFQEDSTGVWYQVMDQAGREGNYLESSASCMFVYSLFKAVRLGIIDARYLPAARKGFEGIIRRFIVENHDGTIDLRQTCLTAGLGNGRDGSYDYYVHQTQISVNDGKAMGPFIMASLEMETDAIRSAAGSDGKQPDVFAMEVYPNPSNASTRISYFLPRTDRVRIEVFAANGRRNVLLADRTESPGRHIIDWDAEGRGAGVYLLVLTRGADRSVKRLIVLK